MAGKERTLESTSTWAVAVVCFVLVAISIAIEQIIHHLGGWLKKKRRLALYEALEKVKAELMLMGFLSFLLTIGQEPLSEICVSRTVGHSWHPCKLEDDDDKYDDPCLKKGKIQLVSAYGIHQLHIFIFTLAIAHILYCILTYGLGRLKMRKWKVWEDETKTIQYEYYNDAARFRFARETSFGRRHIQSWSKSSILLWIVCFFRQFMTSVAKVDYLTLRHGFIAAHLTPDSHSSFDFQKYINKSLEKDFNVIVGISPVIWLCAVLFLLTNTNGWYPYFWLPFIPLLVILLVGAKLQVIITKMGLRIMESGEVIQGVPVVQPGDNLFWFNRPKFTLFLIHFVLFQNAFQLAFFVWSVYEYGYPSCYHENLEDIIIRVTMGVVIQILCSYVTLPLYALVTQMGTNMKPVIFSENVASALRSWHKTAKKHTKHPHGPHSAHTTPYSSRTPSPLHGNMSPVYLLQGHRKYNMEEDLDGEFRTSPGEGALTSPGRHGVNYHAVHTANHNEIQIDVESPRETSKTTQQPQVEIDLADFSFKKGGARARGDGWTSS